MGRQQKNLPNEISDSYALFLRETQTKVSRSYFFEIFSQYTKVQVVKTGGVYTKNNDIVETIVKRSFYGVNMKNTYSIDEKPIIVNNYKSKKVRVTSNHRGKVPSNIVSAYNMMDKLSNLYLLCCISCEGIILYHLSENPIDTAKFNAFMHKLLYSIPKNDFGQFLLIDNATFHSLNEFIKLEMKKKSLAVTRTPPLGCLFNPIEEFFGNFDKALKRNIKFYLYKHGPLDQSNFIELIHLSMKDTVNMDLKQIFRRAGIMDE